MSSRTQLRWASWVVGILAKLLGLLFLTFLLFHLGKVDPARLKLGPMASEASVARERTDLGLDRPILVQFAGFFMHAVQGDLGRSFRSERPALPLAAEKLQRTFLLVLGGLVPALLLSYVLVLAASVWKAQEIFILLPARSLAVLPSFVIAVGGLLLLGLAGIRLSSGSAGWVPCLLLALFPTASLTLLLHSATAVDPPPRPWLLSRSFGFSPFTAFNRALFSPVSVPWITAWTTQVSQAVFTAMVLELVLTIDGGGNLLANAVQQRDLPVLQAVLLLNGAVFLLLQSGASGLAAILDPRQRQLAAPAKPA